MFQSARMRKVKILVLAGDLEKVTAGLGELEALHLSQARTEPEGNVLVGLDVDRTLADTLDMLQRIEHLARVLHVDLEAPAQGGFHEPEVIRQELARLEEEVNQSLKSQQQSVDQIQQLQHLVAQLESFAGVPVPLERLEDFSFLHFAIGALPERKLKSLREELASRAVLVPFQTRQGQTKVIAISSRKGRWALETALANHGFRSEEITGKFVGLPDEILQTTRAQLDQARRGLDDLTLRLETQGREKAGLIRGWRQRIVVQERIVEAQKNFARTQATSLITGWVPVHRVTTLCDTLAQLTGHRAVIEFEDPGTEELLTPGKVPTLLEHPPILRPFQILVKGFGLPGYNEIEPTVLVAVTFLIMFGAMFGDVGHGLVLVILGLLIRWWTPKESVRQFGSLLSMVGLAGMAGGFVYGSFFGRTYGHGWILPPLWADPLERVMSLLLIMAGLGVFMISLGLVLNVINHMRSRDVAGGLLDKYGVAGIWFYWGALGLMVRYAVLGHGALWEAAVLLVPPVLLILLREPITHFLRRNRTPASPTDAHATSMGMQVFEGAIDLLEAVMSYLANTISYLRVGAFALAHAGLMLAIFETEKRVIDLPVGPLWTILVVVVGNAVVIALEGLVVSIQAVRLEYYEFFSKFFQGQGKAYQPFGLK